MKIILPGKIEPTNASFIGTIGQLAGSLDDEQLIRDYGLHDPLTRWAETVGRQLDQGPRYRGRVIGLELISIDFTLILAPPPERVRALPPTYSESVDIALGRRRG